MTNDNVTYEDIAGKKSIADTNLSLDILGYDTYANNNIIKCSMI